MSTQQLFGRTYALQLAPNPFPKSAYAPGWQYGNVGKSPAPLRVTFDIDKDVLAAPNKATFDVYNLSSERRQSLTVGYQIILAAGYGPQPKELFSGLISRTVAKRDGPNIVTTIEATDGGAAIATNTVALSFPPGTKWVEIATKLAIIMGTPSAASPIAISAGCAVNLPNSTFKRGFSAHGRVADMLTKLCKHKGIDWFIHNGTLNFIPKTAHTGNSAALLSSDQGLIGTPSFTAKGVLTFSCLLNADVMPGRLVYIFGNFDKKIEGYYKVGKVKIKGDSHGTTWQNECEGLPFPDSAVTYPTSTNGDLKTAVKK